MMEHSSLLHMVESDWGLTLTVHWKLGPSLPQSVERVRIWRGQPLVHDLCLLMSSRLELYSVWCKSGSVLFDSSNCRCIIHIYQHLWCALSVAYVWYFNESYTFQYQSFCEPKLYYLSFYIYAFINSIISYTYSESDMKTDNAFSRCTWM